MKRFAERRNGGPRQASRDCLEREIASTDAKVDELVYDLYGITQDERKTIEGG